MGKDFELAGQLREMESSMAHADTLRPKISKAPVIWHIDHSLKVVIGICNALANSDPKAYQSRFSASRLFCFTLNYIPRGLARAPKSVRPPDIISSEDIAAQIALAKHKLIMLADLDPHVNFKHPYFAVLNKRQSIRFIRLHTDHHLKIIRDIVGAKRIP